MTDRMASQGSVAAAIDDTKVMVVCGSGGVGKTTVAASIAVMAAMRSERRVLVMTIDPARRLATALGLEELGNAVTEIAPALLAAAAGATSDELVPGSISVDGPAGSPTGPKGRLFAAMLDTQSSWDDLVHRHAPDVDTEQRIRRSPLYRNITGRFVQSHDYIAMERLYELHESGDYDLIVIDTPPASHAIDFLEAPQRMADFFDSKLLRFLVAPSRPGLMSLTAKPFLKIADRLLGRRFLADISELFTLLESMRPGFIERARSVERLLRDRHTSFSVVSTLEPSPCCEAVRFLGELRRRDLHPGLLVLNRALPDVLLDQEGSRAAEALRKGADDLARELSAAGADDLDPAQVARIIENLADNHTRMAALATFEVAQRQELAAAAGAAHVVTVPWFGEELHDLSGLRRVGANIWT